MPDSNQNAVDGSERRGPVLVICIGNELIADDAVGHELFTRLQKMKLPNARIEYAGVGGIALLDHLKGDESEMIVVDAVQFGAPPGTIHRLAWDEMPPSINSVISAHGIGLKEAVEVGRVICPEMLPEKILLIGIEGRCFNQTREAMTPETEAAIDPAVKLILQHLAMLNR